MPDSLASDTYRHPTKRRLDVALSEKDAIERVAAVVREYRPRQHYTEYAIAALVLDALRWPRSDGTVPDD